MADMLLPDKAWARWHRRIWVAVWVLALIVALVDGIIRFGR